MTEMPPAAQGKIEHPRMGHGHAHGPTGRPTSRRVRLIVAAVIAPLVAATAVALLVWWPPAQPNVYGASAADRFRATVVTVAERECSPAETVQTPTGVTTSRCGSVVVRIEQGPEKGRVVVTEFPDGPGAPTVSVGAAVLVLKLTDPDDPTAETRYSIVDRQRGLPMLWIAILAGGTIVGFARWRGLAALVGLTISFAVLLLFVLPAIAAGEPPLPVAVVGAATIMFAVLYLTHGVSVQTSIAVLGTLASLVLTGVLAQLATAATHLTGHGTEDATTLTVYFRDVDVFGLLLAGIIIGSLGVLDDVTVTQAVTVAELADANPAMTRRQLYAAGARVGRAHIASVVNTIVLAYAGTSLPIMLMISGSGSSLGTTLTTEFAAQEIIRSLVATMGLVAAVPLTTALAAIVAAPRRPAEQPTADAEPVPVRRRTAETPADPWAEPSDEWDLT